MNGSPPTPGISRIDQPSHRTHGFFVRVLGKDKRHSGFFSDKKYGGRDRALRAAEFYLMDLRLKFGLSDVERRRRLSEAVRRKGRSGIHGVRRVVRTNSQGYRFRYWEAQWSPLRRVYRKKMFAIRKHGEENAKALAIQARREGVRNMK